MGTFIAAYAIVWLALGLYVARLRTRQRDLERRILSLSSREHRAHVRDEHDAEAGMSGLSTGFPGRAGSSLP